MWHSGWRVRSLAVVAAAIAGLTTDQFQGTWAQEAAGAVSPALPPEAAASPSPSFIERGGQGEGILDVHFADGKVNVTAREADLSAVLKKVAEATGIAVEIGPGVEGKVTASITEESVAKAIERVLEVAGAKNFAAQFDMERPTATLRKVVVLRKGEEGGEYVTRWPFSREYAVRLLAEKYGSGATIDWGEKSQRLLSLQFYRPGVANEVTRDNAREFSLSLLGDLSGMMGLDVEQLGDIRIEESEKRIRIYFQQEIDGIPVEGGSASVEVLRQPRGAAAADMVSVGNSTLPSAAVSTVPRITAEEAVKVAEGEHRRRFSEWNMESSHKDYGDASPSDSAVTRGPTLLIYPRRDPTEKPGRYEYKLCWRIVLGGVGVYYIDATTGEVAQAGTSIVRFDSTLKGEVGGPVTGGTGDRARPGDGSESPGSE